MRSSLTSRAVSLVFLTISVTAQTTIKNLTSTGCQDVGSFTTCSETAVGKAQVCQATAVAEDSALALAACGCVYYIEMMNCYMASCWNRVYECEYQEYAIQYISECPSSIIEIPFFPPPNDAPGSCSCNLGNLYLAVNASETEGAECLTDVSKKAQASMGSDPVTTADKEEACACCGESGAISAFFNICPDTQPTLIGISEVYTYIADLHQSWASCSPYMSAYDCTAELNFTNVAGGTFYTPDNLPASGTATLSIVAGTVSAPPLGTLFSYTNYYDSTIYTITAAVDGNNAGFRGVTGVTEGVPTVTSSGPDATITIKSGAVAGGGYREPWVLVSACFILGLFSMS